MLPLSCVISSLLLQSLLKPDPANFPSKPNFKVLHSQDTFPVTSLNPPSPKRLGLDSRLILTLAYSIFPYPANNS